MATSYSFGRVSDANLLRLCLELIDVFPDTTVAVQFSDTYNARFSKELKSESPIFALLSDTTYLIQHINVSSRSLGFSLYYYRGQIYTLTNGSWGWSPSQSAYLDGIHFTGPNVNPEIWTVNLLSVLTKFIKMAPPLAAVDTGQSALTQTSAALAGLNDAVSALIDHTASRQRDLDETRFQLAEAARKDLEAERGSLRSAIEKERDDLAIESAALSARAQYLDDRANTHVRREIQGEMAKLVDTRLNKSLLGKSEIPYLITLLLPIIACVTLAWTISGELKYISAISNNVGDIIKSEFYSATSKISLIDDLRNQIMFAQVRLGFQAFGFAALVWFALRTATSRYKQVSRWERELNKLRLDTERAAFLVEGDLEARKVNNEGLPSVMLRSFARGLFSATDYGDHAEGGSAAVGDTLTALLGQAAKVQLGPNGVSVEVDRKGVRRAANELTAARDEE